MKTPRTHPSQDALQRYSEHQCDITERLLLDTHLHFCQECALAVDQMRGSLATDYMRAEADDAKSPSNRDADRGKELLNKILVDIEGLQELAGCTDLGLPDFILRDIPDRSRWRWYSFWPSKGKVARVAVDLDGPYDLYVGMIHGPNQSPGHEHRYSEQTLPLLGTYVSNDREFHPGEWSEMAAGEHHKPSARHGHCVCLIRSHRSGFRFTGLSYWRNAIVVFGQLLGARRASV